MSIYREIELFGLVENEDELPIPDDCEIVNQGVREAFEALFGTLNGTGLQSEIEPLAHAFATIFDRRKKKLEAEVTNTSDQIQALIRAQDGSEVADYELTEAQKRYERVYEKQLALETMAEAAAEFYEAETGNAFIPVSGSRTSARAQATGAVFEARELLDRTAREKAEKNKVEGTRIAVSGSISAADVGQIFAKLDQLREKHPDMVLCHKGARGAERIAARWARERGAPQILFQPRWALGKSAPFKANDEIIAARPKGVVLFGGDGVALNLGQKAEEKGIRVWKVSERTPETA
jgi:hypothetical protein